MMTPITSPMDGTSDTRLFAAEVAEYLQRAPRQLPSKYFYDALGSALFEAICRLPWYPITRAESALLERHAAQILDPVARPLSVAELGCGSGEKLALLLERGAAACAQVQLVDVSSDALAQTRDRLREAPVLSIQAHLCGYEEGLRRVAADRPRDGSLVLLFLGSNIGNFDPPCDRAMLTAMRESLRPGDWLLLGTDLVKPERDLLLAYADPLGVTAAFNSNLLRRINDELGGNFDLNAFTHRAIWNAREQRVEMHLVSLFRQRVLIDRAGLDLTFNAGEFIWTESSYKYEPDAVVQAGFAAGFSGANQWIDEEGRFAVTRFAV